MREVREEVRERYARAARSGCGGEACCSETAGFGSSLYRGEEGLQVPAAALQASLGCGNPTAVADLRPGELVLDLGSGGGIDVLLAARRVGPQGRAIGLDMTPEMLEAARRNAAEAGIANVEFIRGYIEDIPYPPPRWTWSSPTA